MANWKKVDADQLDADMTTVADAIRNRAGTTDALSFPDGFVSAVESVPDYLEQRVQGTLTEYSNDRITGLSSYAFQETNNLATIKLPNLQTSGWYTFCGCRKLATVFMPKLSIMDSGTFVNCESLTFLDLPICTEIRADSLTNSGMQTLILRKTDGICTLGGASAFSGTPIANGTGYVYFYRSLVDSYKSETNWSNFANQIRAIEDYPEITGG